MKLNLVSLAVSLSLASLPMLTGCAADTSSEAFDDDASELAESSEDAITGSPSNFGYFVVTRQDPRKCASPMCGGWFVKRVNQATTRCADGTRQPDCYQGTIELNNVGLSQREEEDLRASFLSGNAVLKALQYKKKINGMTIGTLKASEGWVGATGSAATGSFYRAADNGLRCVKAPCPSTTAFQLNGREDHNVIRAILENTATPASQEALDRAGQALGTAEGVIIAGGIALPKCVPNSNCGPLIIAQEFFLRVTRREDRGCGGRGNSSCNAGQFCQWQPKDICGAADAGGLCQYKPDFCTQVFKQVCGCDDKTYSNACVAANAGMSVVSDGACKK